MDFFGGKCRYVVDVVRLVDQLPACLIIQVPERIQINPSSRTALFFCHVVTRTSVSVAVPVRVGSRSTLAPQLNNSFLIAILGRMLKEISAHTVEALNHVNASLSHKTTSFFDVFRRKQDDSSNQNTEDIEKLKKQLSGLGRKVAETDAKLPMERKAIERRLEMELEIVGRRRMLWLLPRPRQWGGGRTRGSVRSDGLGVGLRAVSGYIGSCRCMLKGVFGFEKN